jgi:hypothetical protein
MQTTGSSLQQTGSGQQTPQTLESNPQAPRAPRSLMARFWVAMGDMYGESWTKNYGDTAPDSWAVKLAPYGPAQFRAAVKRCFKREHKGKVPTLPDIVFYCESAMPGYSPKSLPKSPLTEEQYQTGREMAEACRQIALGQVVPI